MLSRHVLLCSRRRTRRDDRIDRNQHRLDAINAIRDNETMSSTATPYQGTGWTDRLLNRGFAFVHIWSHFVQLAAFIAPPFYLLAKVLDLPIIPTGTAFGMGLNAGAACYCGAMEVLGATRDAGDDGIVVAPVTAVVFMSAATLYEWSLLHQFVGVCCVGPLASVCATVYVKLRRPKVS